MKLYTEEQVREALWVKEHPFSDGKNVDEIMKSLTPIELPSDEEIEHELALPNELMNELAYMFIEGAKWMKEQILNQNK